MSDPTLAEIRGLIREHDLHTSPDSGQTVALIRDVVEQAVRNLEDEDV
jgi:hypothetical protein